jgi:hypothetical protein
LAWSPPVWRRRISSPHAWPGRHTGLESHDSGMRLKVTGVELFSAGRAPRSRRMWSGVRGIR